MHERGDDGKCNACRKPWGDGYVSKALGPILKGLPWRGFLSPKGERIGSGNTHHPDMAAEHLRSHPEIEKPGTSGTPIRRLISYGHMRVDASPSSISVETAQHPTRRQHEAIEDLRSEHPRASFFWDHEKYGKLRGHGDTYESFRRFHANRSDDTDVKKALESFEQAVLTGDLEAAGGLWKLVKAYDPDEPRDAGGRWAEDEGEGKVLESLSGMSKDLILTDDEEDSLYSYCGVGYGFINSFLRRGDAFEPDEDEKTFLQPGDWDRSIERAKARIADLDRIMERSNVPTDVTLYRFVSGDPEAMGMSAGSEFEDRGYVSTSMMPVGGMASGWESEGWEKGGDTYFLDIRVPAGTRGVSIPNALDDPGNEFEVLLDRSLRFRVLSRDGRKLVLEVVT